METTSAEDILLRIDTLKELGGDCGRGGLRRWILLDGYNKAVTKNLPHAVQLVELLGVRDESMKQYFGSLWRRAFRNKKKGLGHGFTARVFFNANFISIGDNVGSDAPHTGNIVHRGSDTAMAIRDHVENSIAAAAEDEDTEENNTEDSITAGEGQSSDFNIDDYKSRVAALPMVLMPHGIEVISKHGGIGGIYCTLRTCPILVFAFNRNRAKKRKRPPSEWSLENAISYMKEEIHHNGGVGNTQLQSFLHSTLHLLPKSGDSISLKFFDTQNRTRKSTLQFMKRQRTCDVNASDKSKNDYVLPTYLARCVLVAVCGFRLFLCYGNYVSLVL